MHSPTVLLVLSLILRALSLAHPGPKPTDAASNAPNSVGWTPKPTTVPFANTPLELRRRQNYAPINTCGWIDGNFADPYFCADGYACSANFAAAYFGCCETDSAGSFLSADCAYIATPYTGCYDFTSASFCTGACYTENRVCDNSYPYCALATINMGSEILTNWDCSTDIYVRALDIETSASYTSSFGSGTATTAITTTASNNANIISTSAPGSAAAPNTASSTNYDPSPSSSTTSFVPLSTVTSQRSTSHAGAIAGGVIGTLAALAFLVGGVIFWLHQRKQRQRKVVAPEISQTM